MSKDIFDKNFKPYISKTKGFYALSYDKGKNIYIPTHYSYIGKGVVRPLDFKSSKDRDLYKRMKKMGRVFNND